MPTSLSPQVQVQTHPMVCLVLIVKNESQNIARCIDSARSLVDQILVVDTGSSDDTVAIAQRCGAQVHHFEWVHDFSAARNHALALSTADWNLVLDADEWVLEGSLDLEKTGDYLGLIKLHNLDESSGEPLSSVSWLPRLLPRGVRYQGIVHEQPVSDLPRKKLNLTIQHDGYLHANLAQKKGRNKQLLLQALKASPHDPYIHYQLGVDAEIYGDHAGAVDCYAQANLYMDQPFLYKRTMVVRWLHCLCQVRRSQEALDLIAQYQSSYSDFPDFFFAAGNVYLDHAIAHPQEAASTWLPLAVKAWEHCLEIGEKPDMEGAVCGRGSFLAAPNLFALHSVLGHPKESELYARLAQSKPA